MSGGSYDYLCNWDTTFAVPWGLENMALRLERLGTAPHAAAHTRAIIARAEALRVELDGLVSRELRAVWHAVEWYDSNDWGPKDRDTAIAKYEAGTS